MRAPLSWLRDFAPIEGDPADLAAALSGLGLVVEGMERVGEGLAGVVVARVEATRPHPGADRVQLVDVDAGDGVGLQIVCGAFNFKPGDLVPLAPVGTRLPGGLEIGRRKVRGQWSEGMLCSGVELALSGDGDGIMILPNGVGPGTPLTAALGLVADVVFDLDVTPNRPDALSIAGVARDLAARLRVPFALPVPPPVPIGVSDGVRTEPGSTVRVDSPDLCPRFTATVLAGVAVRPSPTWLGGRLALAGMRAINNVVDVSNYVMLELGQPNHPYDLDRLAGRGLSVRRGRPEEGLETLDGTERRLGPDDCLICDAEGGPVGIGGIMGGRATEIGEGTSTVLLEAASFDSLAIARTAKRLGLRTEASVRFERGVDPDGIERSVARFCQLAAEVAGAQVVGGVVDVSAPRTGPLVVRTRTARVNAILGTSLSPAQVAGYLEPIGFGCRAAPGGADFDVTIPTWRPDSYREIDVIEEVARHHGYDNVERTRPPIRGVGGLNARQRARRQVREVLVGAGLSEAWSTSLVAPADLERARVATDAVEVENPLAQEESVLRTSLRPGLLRALVVNHGHRYPEVALFEIGAVFLRADLPRVPARGGEAADSTRPGVGLGSPRSGGERGWVPARGGEAADSTRPGVGLGSPRSGGERGWVPARGGEAADSTRPGVGLGSPRSGGERGWVPARGGEAADSTEPEVLAAVGAGRDSAWAKRVWDTLADALGLAGAWVEPAEPVEAAEFAGLHPSRSARVLVSGVGVGAVGEIDPEVLAAYGLAGPVGWLEVDLGVLLTAPRRVGEYRPVSRFPSADFDLAFVVADAVAAAAVEATLRAAAGEWLESLRLFDVFRGGQVGPGRRSLAFRLRVAARDRTLAEADLATVRNRCIEAVESSLGATLRG